MKERHPTNHSPQKADRIKCQKQAALTIKAKAKQLTEKAMPNQKQANKAEYKRPGINGAFIFIKTD